MIVETDNYNVVKYQKDKWSCGAAVVVNALRCYGKRVAEHKVRSFSDTSSQFGTSEVGIMTAIREFGFTAVEHRFFDDKEKAWNWLHKTLRAGKPVILCVENWEHWVVAVGSLGKSGVTIVNSSNFKNNTSENGVHIWTKKRLMHMWWNDRKSITEDESRLYAISVGKK